ncbi:hypothetical protein ACQKTA_07270 [Enterococcus sp. 22-H-5-01]|uniref:hypothetical protein n=1 Tax=Enterococcus sp. 22-H-5-01 TaxID=3418555 RepID=UPI003D088B30
MPNTLSLDALQSEIFNTLKDLNDSYVVTDEISTIDKKGIRNSLNTLQKNYPNIFVSNKKSDGSYYFSGDEKEIIKFLSLTKGVDFISDTIGFIKKSLINNDYKKIVMATPSEKSRIFESFKKWMETSKNSSYINEDELDKNKETFLKMLKTSETSLEVAFMEDFLGGYSRIFLETEEYLPTLFDAIFKFTPTEDEIDDILYTFFHINYTLLEGIVKFLLDYTHNDKFQTDFESYSEDVSHNDTWGQESPSPELYQYLIDQLQQAKDSVENRSIDLFDKL